MANELWAALLGGALSLLGTVATLWFQDRNQRRERRNAVARFIVEQGDYLTEVSARLESNFEKYKEVWIEDIDQIEAIFHIFQRNVEHIIHIDDETTRREIRNLFTESFYIAQRARYWQRQNWDHRNKLKELHDVNVEERRNIENEAINAHIEAKNCIIDLKQKASSINGIRSRVDSR